MIVRPRPWLAAALGLYLIQPRPAWAAEPRPSEPPRLSLVPEAVLHATPSANQQTANAIAEHLRQSGQLRRYHIDIAFRDGAAELTGTVANEPQRDEVVRIVQGVPGVDRVVDRLLVTAGDATAAPAVAVTPVQATAPPARLPDPVPAPDAAPPPPGVPSTAPPPSEAMPVFQAPPPSPYALNPPRMPPYAWPTYAPYNNFSRVAYPAAYPYNAWPFIGPIYPFPKVPLGWRSVKLEWDDGYWWYSKVACKYDWWRLRFW